MRRWTLRGPGARRVLLGPRLFCKVLRFNVVCRKTPVLMPPRAIEHRSDALRKSRLAGGQRSWHGCNAASTTGITPWSPSRVIGHLRRFLDGNPLYDVPRNGPLPSVVKSSGARVCMASQILDIFKGHALAEKIGDYGRPK